MQNLDIKICTDCPSRRDLCEPIFDDFRLEVIAESGRYCDRVFVLNPDLLHNIPHGQFLPYSNCDLEAWTPPGDYDWHHPGPVRVLHAPTWRALKGTDAIIAAIEALKAEGENVELVLVEHIPHDQVQALYASADLLVDQLLAGWYGGLAVELMALGKPVIAYIREADLRFIPAAMRADLPIVSANITTLKEILRALVRDTARRKQIGAQSRAFVEKWHHPRVVAKMTTEAYREALAKRPPLRGTLERLYRMGRLARPTAHYFQILYRIDPFRHRLQRWWRAKLGR